MTPFRMFTPPFHIFSLYVKKGECYSLSDFPLLNSVLWVLSPRPLNEKSPWNYKYVSSYNSEKSYAYNSNSHIMLHYCHFFGIQTNTFTRGIIKIKSYIWTWNLHCMRTTYKHLIPSKDDKWWLGGCMNYWHLSEHWRIILYWKPT
jgi:hypothetical protein